MVSHNQLADPNQIKPGQSLEVNSDNQGIPVVVKAGDTVSSLARQYNSSIDQIAKDNDLDSNYTIFVGQQLKITPDDQTPNLDNNQSNNSVPVTSQQPETGNNTSRNTINSTVANGPSVNNQTVNNTSGIANNSTVTNTQIPNSNYVSSATGNEAAAKDWIASRESGGNYNAANGQYIGKYQLSSTYLGGDYSPANQERTADQYVQGRYGSWTAVLASAWLVLN